ncbi:putative chromatin remodeler Bromodomain family [Helianthus annuus]|uniref:Chromatin remodeler Bromodomain family n=2 Tax=Helianthus annuus TaxID=4232 RepID=A0A9K3HP36_HELAN|nr:bromodomain-containing factor 2 [Helianthus annuus]KAF5781780.1 putative chromatin remodeler Bromodomain family [Helianthus annuus]KAJ0509101.1 putative chromatin remodeler Bromodomain family [Helianthus annuus]KAJ0517240.1 putative chromatin remodeler Bromodomain family [Helianthus annuus]KAJ0638885.1 putative chromatin remodeler Bromodomain family [Helianthus annuus]KAJ0685248.1 putative chromatin remodeler Bromodomain family [Helianthus annuus]
MKRKRGKKGKSGKAPKVGTTEADPNIDNVSDGDTSGSSDTEKDETTSRIDIKTPSTGTDQPEKPPPVSSTGVTDNKPVGRLVYNRVKVKIKSSKPLEPQLTSSDAHTHSDTDKSTPHIGLEKPVVSEKVEDSANSVPETNIVGSTSQPKKAGSIKIITSKGFSSSLSPCSNTGVPQVEKTHQKEPESVPRDSVYNKQELNASLEVIKKIMKMDAAEPFNVPVNPVALGIPDYFDVIKTPMDFGTICSNLESGIKYMNSEDVYKDVRFIWENCYKYNNKGDYILELMKRVKKNFSKYWSAAGLYSEQGDMKDGNVSSHGKSSNKGGNLKNKSKKRQGVKRHKDDCLCAICIMMRRRQEREQLMNPADDPETSDGLVKEVKHEGTSTAGSPTGDDTSSSTDNSQNQDVDVEMEDKEEKLKLEKETQSTLESKHQENGKEKILLEGNKENVIAERSQQDVISGNEDIQMTEAGDANKDDSNNAEKMKQQEDENAAYERPKQKEVLDAGEKAKLIEKLHQRYDNAMVLELYASLFPANDKSVWSRPHSLVHRHRGSSRGSAIGAAIASFMKK